MARALLTETMLRIYTNFDERKQQVFLSIIHV
jgi:hypothetical protein